MEQKIAPKKYLSASRVKTLETCSWVYWCKYNLNLPDPSNDGAMRGTICHLIFELLINKRHLKHFNAMTKKGSIQASKAVDRLVIKNMKKVGIFTDENYTMIGDMILVGLKNDFFGGKGATIDKPEQEFEITNESPRYKIKGFIDKPIKYDKKKIVKIIDYKSSKYKFRGDDLESNLQAMMYSLASKTIWPGYKPVVEFLFLRHPKQPIQQLEYTEEQLKGFEGYLEHVSGIIDNFDEAAANANFATFNPKSKWMCGIGKWVCPFKSKMEYYALIEDGKIVKSSLKDDLRASDKQKVEKRSYAGCPKFNFDQTRSSTKTDDAFSDLT